MDRTSSSSVKTAVGHEKFDLIIDKVAYSSNDVKALLENIACEKYIQMSTCSVYPSDGVEISETAFDGSTYHLRWMDRTSDYQESKRQAERAAYEFLKPEQIAFVRYPIVMGKNDYTGRLRFYVDHIAKGTPMFVDDYDKSMAFINEDEAGIFIAYLAEHFVSGPINGCSFGTIKIGDMISYIEKKLGKKAVLSEDGEAAPYNGLADTSSFDTIKAMSIGYKFSRIDEWIYELLDYEIKPYESKKPLEPEIVLYSSWN
jgi:hypothetical protein